MLSADEISSAAEVAYRGIRRNEVLWLERRHRAEWISGEAATCGGIPRTANTLENEWRRLLIEKHFEDGPTELQILVDLAPTASRGRQGRLSASLGGCEFLFLL